MNNRELLLIETDEFTLLVRGPLPSAGAFALRGFSPGVRPALQPREAFHVELPSGDFSYPLLRVRCPSPRLRAAKVSVSTPFDQGDCWPLFFEHVDYQVLLTGASGRRFELRHADPNITANLSRGRDACFGTFNFGANVGTSRFEVVEEGHVFVSLDFLVCSTKIDFLRERHAMLRDLTRAHHALMFQVFKPTASSGAATTQMALGLEWLVTFADLAHDVQKTATRIEQQAHNRIVSQEEIVATRKIKRPGKTLLRQMATRGKDQVLSRRGVLVERRRVQVSTPENRYLKFLMRRLVSAGQGWVEHARGLPVWSAKKDDESQNKSGAFALIDAIDANLTRLERSLKGDFWTAVGEELPVLLNKTTFLFHDLFVRFEKLSRTIHRGVSLHEAGSRTIYTLSMEKLFEAWTYLRLVEIASTLVNGPGSVAFPKIEADTFRAVLQTGQAARVVVSDKVSITAQRTYKKYTPGLSDLYFSPLVEQKPDLVFEVRNGGSIHLLDAKYRVHVAVRRDHRLVSLGNADLVTQDLAGVVVLMSPKEEDINAMHRYKDAIRFRSGLSDAETTAARRAAKLGVILYPRKPTAAEQASLERGLHTLSRFEIGAVPLAPGEPDTQWQTALATGDWIPVDPETEQVRVLAGVVARMLA